MTTNRRTLVGIPALELGALPSAEIAEVPAPWSIQPEPFDLETYRAMVRAEDEAQFRELCRSLMIEFLNERKERISARQVQRKPKRRIPGFVIGAGVTIVTALATFAVFTSLFMKGP